MSDANPIPPADLKLHCLKCGYNVTGLPSSQCPECGTPFDLEELRRSPIHWSTPFLGRGPVTLMLLAPAMVLIAFIQVFVRNNDSSVVHLVVLLGIGMLVALIAAIIVGRRAARAFARKQPGDPPTPATIGMTLVYGALILALEFAAMFFVSAGACGVAAACSV